MDSMNTVAEILNKLYKKGYTIDFNQHYPQGIAEKDLPQLCPEDFVVDKHYRFEGESDPGDEAIIYAISSIKHQLKGVLVNGYGISSDQFVNELISSLKVNPYTYPVND